MVSIQSNDNQLQIHYLLQKFINTLRIIKGHHFHLERQQDFYSNKYKNLAGSTHQFVPYPADSKNNM